MRRTSIALSTLAAGLLLAASVPAAQTPGGEAAPLTPLDYIEIRQLVAKYAYALDSGSNDGYGYADLFTPDGVFTGMNQGPAGRAYTGRDTLAGLARGGRRGPLFTSHYITNVVIEPAPGGARGTQYLAILALGDGQAPHAVDHGGRYEDFYVKTRDGWRFKSRTFYGAEGGATPSQLAKHPVVPEIEAGQSVAPAPAAPAGTLTIDDYLEIQALVTSYPYALDTGANDGYMYADLFAEGGEFIRPYTVGRDDLAKLALDQPHGPAFVRHFLMNQLIEPAEQGATGRQYLVVIDVGQGGQPGEIFVGGHYEDEYVKTPDGWRFKRREFIPSRSGAQPPEAGRGGNAGR